MQTLTLKMIIQNENYIKQNLYNSHKFKYFLQTSFSMSPFICSWVWQLEAVSEIILGRISTKKKTTKNMNNMHKIINFLSMWTNKECSKWNILIRLE